MSSVVMESVRKVYPNGFCAIKGAKLVINPGEFMVLVGPSGSAKSTLLRMVAGLEDVSEGKIFINNREVTNIPSKDRGIAMVFQNYALYPHMSCFDNMAFGLKLKKVPRSEIEARVRHVAGLLEIEHLLDRKPKEMSGGQRQRVALGRALIREPEVFLFDEPLSNLDAKLRVSTRQRIKSLHNYLKSQNPPPSMIYVTHDQTEAMTMGDRICVLKEGEIQQVGTPLALYHRPVNRFVAQFIGSPAMNIFSATRIGDELVNDDFRMPLPAYLNTDIAEGMSVDVGFRPESLNISAGSIVFSGKLQDAELMGNGSYLRVTALEKGDELCIHLTGEHPELPATGSTFSIYADASKAHFFDAESGRRLGDD